MSKLLCKLFGHKCNTAQLLMAEIEMKNGIRNPKVYCQREKVEYSWKEFRL